jgi:hypothetical protein
MKAFDIVLVCIILVVGEDYLTKVYVLIPLVLTVVIAISLGVLLAIQPQSSRSITFKMPLVPLLPLISIFINFYLMALLNVQTWIRFTIWMLIGFVIYFGYGIRNSTQKDNYSRLRDSSSSSSEDSSSEYGQARTSVNRVYEDEM